MRTTSIDIHLDDGEQPEVGAYRHKHNPGTGYVHLGHIGALSIHGRPEDLAAMLSTALDAVNTLLDDRGEVVAS